jgi:hypothetical protein
LIDDQYAKSEAIVFSYRLASLSFRIPGKQSRRIRTIQKE